jgi:hypothetical protein
MAVEGDVGPLELLGGLELLVTIVPAPPSPGSPS